MKKLLMVVFMMFWGAAYADTETINWYKDGAIYNTTTCETGGNITLPAAPPKRGYNFTGWTVLLYDFSTLDASIGGSSHGANNTSMTWTTTFSYGVVSGQALCSQTSGTLYKPGVPDESGDGETKYCWCKATGYKPSGDDKVYENTSANAWVFNGNRVSASGCASNCAIPCANTVKGDVGFRQEVFGITQ